ncbi:MAG: hypothetical protein AAF208_01975 [Cyanobacteria bacterium P01_A01_bin.45]
MSNQDCPYKKADAIAPSLPCDYQSHPHRKNIEYLMILVKKTFYLVMVFNFVDGNILYFK